MSPSDLESRVKKAAGAELAEKGYVAPLEVLVRMGWLEQVRVDEWRERLDAEFQSRFAAAILELFPGCPPERAAAVAGHAALRGSGRVGRTSAGRALEPEAVRLAVAASVRHHDTRYDELLMGGVERSEARATVRDDVDQVLNAWSPFPAASTPHS